MAEVQRRQDVVSQFEFLLSEAESGDVSPGGSDVKVHRLITAGGDGPAELGVALLTAERTVLVLKHPFIKTI